MTESTRLSRREALTRMAAMSGSLSVVGSLIGCVYPEHPGPEPPTSPDWPDTVLAEITAPGYGTDPNLIAPLPVPWGRTLTREQRNLLTSLGEIICPGSSGTGVTDVLDEWLSAPYPDQQTDRQLILPGIEWLDNECQALHGEGFINLALAQQHDVVDVLARSADQGDESKPARFFYRLRGLVTGAHYSSPQGVRELGYVGNVPIAGDYPGPSEEALQQLEELLDELGLTL